MSSTSSFLIFSTYDAGIVQTLPCSMEDTSSRRSLFRHAGTLDADDFTDVFVSNDGERGAGVGHGPPSTLKKKKKIKIKVLFFFFR
jgi:hypothetical protein